jgi:hypothetical protein
MLHLVLTGCTEGNLRILNPLNISAYLGPWSHTQMVLVRVPPSSLCLLPLPDTVLHLFREIANGRILLNAFRGEQADVRHRVRSEDRGNGDILQNGGNIRGLPPIHAAMGTGVFQVVSWTPEQLKEITPFWKTKLRDISDPKLEDPNISSMGLARSLWSRLMPKHASPFSLLAQQPGVSAALGFTLNLSNRAGRPWFVHWPEKRATQLAFPHPRIRASTWMKTDCSTCQRNEFGEKGGDIKRRERRRFHTYLFQLLMVKDSPKWVFSCLGLHQRVRLRKESKAVGERIETLRQSLVPKRLARPMRGVLPWGLREPPLILRAITSGRTLHSARLLCAGTPRIATKTNSSGKKLSTRFQSVC